VKNLKLEDIFPYEYVGGGYFRKKDVPIGKKADMLHGIEAIKFLFEEMRKQNEQQA
jgi:hypothetical protein